MKIKLIQEPYITGTSLRLPTEDGAASIYVMEGEWYEAAAEDDSGNSYNVLWNILPDWDREDESSACDWDNPCAIISLDPWKDVTNKVTIK